MGDYAYNTNDLEGLNLMLPDERIQQIPNFPLQILEFWFRSDNLFTYLVSEIAQCRLTIALVGMKRSDSHCILFT